MAAVSAHHAGQDIASLGYAQPVNQGSEDVEMSVLWVEHLLTIQLPVIGRQLPVGDVGNPSSQYKRNGNILGAVWGLVTYLLDIGSDWYLVVTYFLDGHIVWACLTLAFILVPQLFIAFIGLMWYKPIYAFKDMIRGHQPDICRTYFILKTEGSLDSDSIIHLLTILTSHSSQDVRYVDYLRYSPYSESASSYRFWASQLSITARLRFLESCLESLPQLVLQIYIVLTFGSPFHWSVLQVTQICSIVFSLISATAGIVLLHGAVNIRRKLLRNPAIRFCLPAQCLLGPFLHFFGRLFILSARCFTIAVSVRYFPGIAGAVLCGHFITMSVCVRVFELGHVLSWTLCDTRGIRVRGVSRIMGALVRYVIVPFMYLFDYVDEMDNGGLGRKKYFPWLYCALHFTENAALLVVCSGYSWTAIASVLGISFSGMGLVRLYCRLYVFGTDLITVASNTLGFENFPAPLTVNIRSNVDG
ncbi:XK-related protein 6-like [Paramacrobiotus metropolitanus]|uniref:XK-related protein 6-like n=1 Tax=Paramacrobiotus metropolitanus TaxID=2943436 RepID=UPI0024465CF4|nr:XK-related protein 6-like [Paramacrobiotus metropolitanus]